MTVYLIDLQVRTKDDNCPDAAVKEFLISKGVEVLGCCGYEDPDSEEN